MSRPTMSGVRTDPIGPGVYPSVGVAAHRVVDRAVVEARAAADAAQHLAELASQHGGAPVVDEHDVELLGAVEVRAPARAGGDGGVGRHLLSGGAPREEPEHGREVLESRQHLLDPGDDDVHPRQGVAEVTVALVGDDDRRARFRDEEVRPRDPHVGAEEIAPQHLARPRDELRVPEPGRPEAERGVVLGEEIADLLAGLVDGRGDNVARRLARELDDVLAEVRLDNFDVRFLERLVEADLLPHHRLALGDGARARLAADAEDEGPRLGRVHRPVHLPARGGDLRLEALEVEVEVREGVVLDAAGRLAQFLKLGQSIDRLAAVADEPLAGAVEREAKSLVGEGQAGPVGEAVGFRNHRSNLGRNTRPPAPAPFRNPVSLPVR